MQILDTASLRLAPELEPVGPAKWSLRARLAFLLLTGLGLWAAIVSAGVLLGTLPQ